MSTHYGSPIGKIRAAVIICCFILIIGIFAYALITNTNGEVSPKDEILAKLEALEGKDLGYDEVSSYLKEYGITNIITYKIDGIEEQLKTEFYKPLPEEKDLARATVLLFVEHYYDNIDLENKNQVTDAILKCIFDSIGDPYAYYRTKAEFDEYLAGLEGGNEFVGIGVMMNRETLEILMVYPDSGAEEAGIKPCDVIYAVDGKTLSDVSSKEELLDLVKGEENTTVAVTVKRGEELIDFTVTRRRLTERSVYHSMDTDSDGNTVGIIQLMQFQRNTPAQFTEAVDYCMENGAKALVIDVRYNPGGLIDAVCAVIDYLVPDAEDRRIGSYAQLGDEYVYYTKDNHSVDVPVVVICNEGTASAGELFTAAMRDYGEEGVMDTVIIGTTTFGKGVAQTSYSLYDGSGITFTIGYFNPPCDVNFDGVGVIPEIEVEEVASVDAPLSRALEEAARLIGNNSGAENDIGNAA